MIAEYEIRVPHAASDLLRQAFPELAIVPIAENATLLIGLVRDQSELHGILARISDLGLDIVEVHART